VGSSLHHHASESGHTINAAAKPQGKMEKRRFLAPGLTHAVCCRSTALRRMVKVVWIDGVPGHKQFLNGFCDFFSRVQCRHSLPSVFANAPLGISKCPHCQLPFVFGLSKKMLGMCRTSDILWQEKQSYKVYLGHSGLFSERNAVLAHARSPV